MKTNAAALWLPPSTSQKNDRTKMLQIMFEDKTAEGKTNFQLDVIHQISYQDDIKSKNW